MKSKAKVSIIIIISIILNICLTGCWNSRELNSIAFMTAMGFDKTEKGIKLTVQVLNPRAIASQKAVNEPSVIVFTDEGHDTIEIIRRLITQSSRKLNATHMETVVFSEDFSREGISGVLDFMSREHQFRTQLYFMVAKGTSANNILTTISDMDPVPSAKLFNSLKASQQVWAGTKIVKSIDLINDIISDGKNPVLTGVELNGGFQGYDNLDKLKDINSDPLRIEGLAVFENDKFIGWMDEDESKGFNYITGHVTSTMSHIESEKTGKISVEVIETKSKQTAVLINGKPKINVNISVKVNIETVSNAFDITKEENIELIERLAKEKLLKLTKNSVERAQKELGIDVFGFGEVVHRKYPQEWKTMKNDWNKIFKNIQIEINGEVKIIKTGPISKSFFTKDSE